MMMFMTPNWAGHDNDLANDRIAWKKERNQGRKLRKKKGDEKRGGGY